MIDDWKRKRSCVGVCYLVKLRMMKDRKFRRQTETWNESLDVAESVEENIDDGDDKIKTEEDKDTSSSSSPIFSQLLWDSYIKKTQRKSLDKKPI